METISLTPEFVVKDGRPVAVIRSKVSHPGWETLCETHLTEGNLRFMLHSVMALRGAQESSDTHDTVLLVEEQSSGEVAAMPSDD